jgi:hypothetical protein
MLIQTFLDCSVITVCSTVRSVCSTVRWAYHLVVSAYGTACFALLLPAAVVEPAAAPPSFKLVAVAAVPVRPLASLMRTAADLTADPCCTAIASTLHKHALLALDGAAAAAFTLRDPTTS